MLDAPNATDVLCHRSPHGSPQQRELIDRVSEVGFSVPLSAHCYGTHGSQGIPKGGYTAMSGCLCSGLSS